MQQKPFPSELTMARAEAIKSKAAKMSGIFPLYLPSHETQPRTASSQVTWEPSSRFWMEFALYRVYLLARALGQVLQAAIIKPSYKWLPWPLAAVAIIKFWNNLQNTKWRKYGLIGWIFFLLSVNGAWYSVNKFWNIRHLCLETGGWYSVQIGLSDLDQEPDGLRLGASIQDYWTICIDKILLNSRMGTCDISSSCDW